MNHYVGPGNGTQGLQLLGPLQAECRFLLQIIFLLYLLIVCTNMCPDVPMEVRGQPEEVTSFLPPWAPGIKFRSSGLVVAPLPAKPSQLSVCTGSSVNAAFGFPEWIPWVLLRCTVSTWSGRWQLAHIPLVCNILTCFSVNGALSLVKCLWKSSLFDLDRLFSYDRGSSVCDRVLLHITLIIQLQSV